MEERHHLLTRQQDYPAGATAGGLDILRRFSHNLTLRGDPAPVRASMRGLLADVLEGHLAPSPVFDLQVSLDDLPAGHAAMDEPNALKVLVKL